MSRKLPLDTLISLATTRTDDAARRLGVLQTAHTSTHQRLTMLLEYRQGYYDQLQLLMDSGMPSAQWSNYQRFLQTLDRAIEQQRAIANHSTSQLDGGRVDWQQQRRKLNSFDTLAERAATQLRLAQGKQEQRESDERSGRAFAQRGSRSFG
ncbi:flagellar export protein FliJ [Variovorax ginsengisoli]|uniref:Flagellar FliJ protein n=1 Tax=Variovorax ginsengisoli TaxID=363844 RepID=A0ABT9SEW6_9BURK|nr:flagellar export protein FliJ [Variovorax ginsengisoli]MDP9902296.1 flagellar FliJ protein [Variovorax ginsengisoli]